MVLPPLGGLQHACGLRKLRWKIRQGVKKKKKMEDEKRGGRTLEKETGLQKKRKRERLKYSLQVPLGGSMTF